MSYSVSIDMVAIEQWIISKRTANAIEEELVAKGLDAEKIAAHLAAFKKMRNSKRQGTGFIYMGIGALLGFISCVCTLTNAIPFLYNVILYGLTSAAILFILIGLYFVVE